MTTALQANVDSLPAVDVVAVTVKVPYHLELATAALGAGKNTTALATPPDPRALITFIAEVAPHVRERVTERPASSSPRSTTSRVRIDDLHHRHLGRTKEDERNEHHPRN